MPKKGNRRGGNTRKGIISNLDMTDMNLAQPCGETIGLRVLCRHCWKAVAGNESPQYHLDGSCPSSGDLSAIEKNDRYLNQFLFVNQTTLAEGPHIPALGMSNVNEVSTPPRDEFGNYATNTFRVDNYINLDYIDPIALISSPRQQDHLSGLSSLQNTIQTMRDADINTSGQTQASEEGYISGRSTNQRHGNINVPNSEQENAAYRNLVLRLEAEIKDMKAKSQAMQSESTRLWSIARELVLLISQAPNFSQWFKTHPSFNEICLQLSISGLNEGSSGTSEGRMMDSGYRSEDSIAEPPT